jgi:hypothetical protein
MNFKVNYNMYKGLGDARQRTWLSQYATSRKVEGSIPDEVTGFLNWFDLSSRTMALGSTQPLTEMSNRNLPGGNGRWRVRLTSLPSVSRLSREKVEASTSHNSMGLHVLLQGGIALSLRQLMFNTNDFAAITNR